MADLSHCGFALAWEGRVFGGKAYHKDLTRTEQARKNLVDSLRDNFRSRSGRKLFEFLPDVLRFDLDQAGGFELCRTGVFADDVVAADTFEG